MTDVRSVVVVGAGVMGTAIAARLASAGTSVTVLEQYPEGHELGGSHGATRLFRFVYDTVDYVALTQEAHRAWAELEAESGETVLHTIGGVEHGMPDDAIRVRTELLEQAGLAFDVLTPHQAATRWPGMLFDGKVLYQPDAARIDATAARRALRARADAASAVFHFDEPVVSLQSEGAGVRVVTTASEYASDAVVVAAGAWSADLLAGRIDLPPITLTREQPRFFAPLPGADPETWPNFVHWHDGPQPIDRKERYGLYEPGTGLKLGIHAAGQVISPGQPSAGEDAVVAEAVREHARRWFPGVDADDSTWIDCLYDNTPTDDFVLDRRGAITVAAGFSGHGFKFAPSIGDVVAGLVDGDEARPAFRLPEPYGGLA